MQETQEKIDVVKGRLIRDYGYDDESATDVLNFVASIFARGDVKDRVSDQASESPNRRRAAHDEHAEDRSRHEPIPPDRPRQDPRESAEVRHARRDDRPQGTRPGQHSRAAARHAPLPLRPERIAAASGRATAKKVSRSPAATDEGGHRASRQRSRRDTSWKSTSTLEELAEILGDELELPRIEPKGDAQHRSRKRPRYNSIRRTGPESLRHFKRTYVASAAAADCRPATTTPPTRASFPSSDDKPLSQSGQRSPNRRPTPSSST